MADLEPPRHRAPRSAGNPAPARPSDLSVAALWSTLVLRAWVPTLAVAALAVSFHYPDQTADLLRGMLEDTKPTGVGAAIAPQLGVQHYAAFWFASLLLAAVLGLAVCVTGQPWPGSAGSGDGPSASSEVRASAWIVVAVSVAVMHGASLLTWPSEPVQPIVALAMTAAGWGAARGRSSRCRRACLAIAVVLAVFCAGLIWVDGDWRNRLLTWSAWLTPAGVAVAALLLWSGHVPRPIEPLLQRVPQPQQSLVLVSVALGVLVYAGSAVWSPQEVGGIASVLFRLAFLVALGALLIDFVRRRTPLGRRPEVALLLSSAVFVWWAWLDERPGKETLQGPSQATAQGPRSRAGVADFGIAIHADGGGLRAAFFTASVLALADDLTCGRFGTHLFAASGVSGGALGIASWAVLRQELVARRGGPEQVWKECLRLHIPARVMRGEGIPTYTPPLANLVLRTLARDHLAAPLAAMVTPGPPWRSAARRGQALVDSWQEAALDAIRATVAAEGPPRAFAIPLGQLDAGIEPRPLLLFTSTDVDRGERVVLSNIDRAPHDRFSEMATGLAALHSARFPLISPAGLVEVADGGTIRLVDGGFTDNSGATSLVELLRALPEGRRAPARLRLLRLDGNPAEEVDARCGRFHGALRAMGYLPGGPSSARGDAREGGAAPRSHVGNSALLAFWNARSARAREAAAAIAQDARRAGLAGAETLRPDPLPLLNPACLADPAKATDEPEAVRACVSRNVAICQRADPAVGPLGWRLSQSAVRGNLELAFSRLVEADFLRELLAGGEQGVPAASGGDAPP